MRYTLPLLASLLAVCACSNDTVTHYAIARDKGTERWYTINPTEYAIDFNQQRVIGSAAGFISRYDDCLVKSLDNWECNADNGDRVFGFLEGEFWEVAKHDVPPDQERRTVSAFEWWRVHLAAR
jgi:hypothetical protein